MKKKIREMKEKENMEKVKKMKKNIKKVEKAKKKKVNKKKRERKKNFGKENGSASSGELGPFLQEHEYVFKMLVFGKGSDRFPEELAALKEDSVPQNNKQP